MMGGERILHGACSRWVAGAKMAGGRLGLLAVVARHPQQAAMLQVRAGDRGTCKLPGTITSPHDIG